jgi:hypothetical protein
MIIYSTICILNKDKRHITRLSNISFPRITVSLKIISKINLFTIIEKGNRRGCQILLRLQK